MNFHVIFFFPIFRGVLCVIVFWSVRLSQIQHTDDMENEIDELLQEFEDKSHRPFLHTVCFYWPALNAVVRLVAMAAPSFTCRNSHVTWRAQSSVRTVTLAPAVTWLSLSFCLLSTQTSAAPAALRRLDTRSWDVLTLNAELNREKDLDMSVQFLTCSAANKPISDKTLRVNNNNKGFLAFKGSVAARLYLITFKKMFYLEDVMFNNSDGQMGCVIFWVSHEFLSSLFKHGIWYLLIIFFVFFVFCFPFNFANERTIL